MSAIRCAARRLGGSLLQRTQAEEGRLLVPRRFIHSRYRSMENARKMAEEQEQNERLYQQAEVDLREATRKVHMNRKLTSRPKRFIVDGRSFSLAQVVKSVMNAAGKLTIFCLVATSVLTARSGNEKK